MERRQRDVWLTMQGYHRHGLKPKITWYGYQGREFEGRSDNYTVDLYRGKGFVLDRKYLDPDLWQSLEYVGVEATPERLPDLAREIVGMLHGKNYWKGTASEMLLLLRSRYDNTPVDPIRLAMEISGDDVTKGLASKGISLTKKRIKGKRWILISREG